LGRHRQAPRRSGAPKGDLSKEQTKGRLGWDFVQVVASLTGFLNAIRTESTVLLHGADGRIYRKNESFDISRMFVPVKSLNPPRLSANGMTPMGEAMNWAFDLITLQKTRYNEYGTPYFRPWVFCVTDGEPNDDYQSAAARLKQLEKDSKVLGYCVGVENFKRDVMATIFDSARIFELKNLDFPGLFKYFSNTLCNRFLNDAISQK
jgi:hypothetical protein